MASPATDDARAPAKRQKNTAGTSTADTSPPLPATAAAADPRSDLTALPSPLLKLIFAYASDGSREKAYIPDQLFPNHPFSLQESMPQLLIVCQAWNRLVTDITSEFQAATFRFRIQTAQPKRITTVIYQALEAKNSDRFRDLRVKLSKPQREDDPRGRAKNPVADSESLEIDWQRVFAHCPQLRRLDLSQVPLNSKHLWKALDAASMHCRELQALILPGDELDGDDEPQKPNFPVIMSTIFRAMERWHEYQGPSGGLRQLSVSKRHLREEDDLSDIVRPDEFFDHVARFCPNIEYLTGWKKPNINKFSEDGDNTWLCSLDEWRHFCRTCTQLREFYWFHAPLDDALLDIFAAYPKLNLKKMVFAWGNSFTEHTHEYLFTSRELHHQGKFELTSRGIAKAISACPALEELHFWIGGGEQYYCQFLDQETNDDVLRTVATCCLHLKRFIIHDVVPTEGSAGPIQGITDAGLIAISKLPKLEHVALKLIDTTAVGILALIQNAPDPQRRRRVVIELGFCETDICCFEELEKLMSLLVRSPEDSLRGRCFELELQMLSNSRVAKATRPRMCSLAYQIAARHQDVAVLFDSFHDKGGAEPPEDVHQLDSVVFISPSDMAARRWKSRDPSA